MQKKHVIFLVDRETVEAEPQAFKAGSIYELADSSCERWIKREAARYATADEVKAAAKAAKKVAAKQAEDVSTANAVDQAADSAGADAAAGAAEAAGAATT